jgi:hypothetical protein
VGGDGDVGLWDTWAVAGQAKIREMLISWIFRVVGAHVPLPGHVSRGARARGASKQRFDQFIIGHASQGIRSLARQGFGIIPVRICY